MKPITETQVQIYIAISKIQDRLPFFWEDIAAVEKLAELRENMVWRIGVPLANQIRR